MIEIYRRNSFSKLASYTEDGIVKDMTGYTVKTVLKKENDISNSDEYALVNKSYVITGTTFDISLTSAETNIPEGKYKFEVQLSKDDDIITIYQNTIQIKATYIKQ